ncbi:EIN3-binding F-box protein 1 [Platanthera zijinensis]|uniref:EIN3-binding F-box protein 1 n=1 Tax=Platanthera zijinensis TaxID=2320716 RepID=A0AAP0ASL5_9ASPA
MLMLSSAVSGDEKTFLIRSPCMDFMDSSCLLCLAPDTDAFYRPLKRLRVAAPFTIFMEEKAAAPVLKKQQPTRSIDDLPEECLFEILRRLSRSQDRSIASCVSKQWLMLLSSIRASKAVDYPLNKGTDMLKSLRKPLPDLNEAITSDSESDSDAENDGFLTRCLEGDEATDTRLAAIAISTAGHGGLGKMKIRGGHSLCKVTDIGLSAIGKLCPFLHTLSLWNIPLVGDAGLSAIADGCAMLACLDLYECPLITDKVLIEIAQKCPNLSSLTLDSCSRISNDGLQAIGGHCQNLVSVSVKDCPLVGDRGISGLVAHLPSLARIKIQNLNINDVSLAVIGHYGKAVTDISLTGLEKISERGFWIMANALNLVNLTSCTISCCPGITDLSLEAISKCCPRLKHLRLQSASNFTDTGLKYFALASRMLESLHLENCNRITLHGVVDGLLSCSTSFKNLALVRCLGIRDIAHYRNEFPTCLSLRSLTIRDCPGFTDCSLAWVGEIFPNLRQIDLRGLFSITDAGFLPLVRSSESRLAKMNLTGCINISDLSISALVKTHGRSLKLLNLDGCKKITDKSLFAIVSSCLVLQDLDVSRCAVTDIGVAALSSAERLNLRVLSLAGCHGVTKRSLQLLGNMKGSLEGLNLQQCKLFNPHGIGLLEEKLWWCDILS